ncbi:MAG: DUF2235 domain-containing protein [Acidobacteriota bacterium]
MSRSTGSETDRDVQEAHASLLQIVGVPLVFLVVVTAVGWIFNAPFVGAVIGAALGVIVLGIYLFQIKTGRLYWRVATLNLSQPSEAPRNHIICIDGTAMHKEKKGNVYRFYDSIQDDCKRYYRGVGVKDNKDVALRVFKVEHGGTAIGGATGHGATALLRRAYFDFVKEYRPGDRIFIFGFSRGAAIARVLANWICRDEGLPESVRIQCLKRLTREDSVEDFEAKWPATKHTCQIEMLGLWDTVAAFGNPFNKKDPFDFTIPDGVKKTYHLVSIDEKRGTFDITLIKHNGQDNRVEEIWFAGDHSNVGGGLPDCGLSDISLRFMINRASGAINFTKEAIEFKGQPFKLKPEKQNEVVKLFSEESGWYWGSNIIRAFRVESEEPGALPHIHKSVFELKEALKLAGCKKYLQNVPEFTARDAYRLEERD